MTASRARRQVSWVSVRRAGDLIGCAPQTVHRMIADGELEATKVATEAGHERTYVSLASVEAVSAARKDAA